MNVLHNIKKIYHFGYLIAQRESYIMTIEKKDITCPYCGKKDTWKESNPFRPFCSTRCKLIDLGDWAAEGHRIPGDPIDPNQEIDSENSSEENKKD